MKKEKFFSIPFIILFLFLSLVAIYSINRQFLTLVDIPNFKSIKAMWYSCENEYSQSNEDRIKNFSEVGFNTIYDARGLFKRFYQNNMPESIKKCANIAKKNDMTYCPAFMFYNVKENSPIELENAIYYDPSLKEMKKSVLTPPLSRAYWRYMTDVFKNISNNEEFKIDCLGFDFEKYEAPEEYFYYTYEGSYDDETFNEFYSTLQSPPSNPSWDERRNWLVEYNLTKNYTSFVSNKAVELSKMMIDEVQSINSKLYIGEYPSPTYYYDSYGGYYPYAIILDFLKGWGQNYPPVIWGTDSFNSYDSTTMPPELSETSSSFMALKRRDNQDTIYTYYIGGFLIGQYDTKYTKNNLSAVYEISKKGNGYWIFKDISLFYPCNQLPDKPYRLKSNCENEPFVESPNYNLCYNEELMPEQEWDYKCADIDKKTKNDYLSTFKELNEKIDAYYGDKDYVNNEEFSNESETNESQNNNSIINQSISNQNLNQSNNSNISNQEAIESKKDANYNLYAIIGIFIFIGVIAYIIYRKR